MNPSKVKMVGETENAFEMHDGKSSFRVAKKGLSPKLMKQIQEMADQPPVDFAAAMAPSSAAAPAQYVKGAAITGASMPPQEEPREVATVELNHLPEDPGLKAQREEERIYGAPSAESLRKGPWETRDLTSPIPVPPAYATAGAAPGASGAGGGPGAGVASPSTVFDPTRGGHVPDVGQGNQGGGMAPKPSLTPSRVADMSGLPGDLRLKGAPSNGPAIPTIGPQTPAPARAGGGGGGAGSMPGMADIRGGLEVQKGANVMAGEIEADKARQSAELIGNHQKQMEAAALEEKTRLDQARSRTEGLMASYKAAQDEMRNINTTVDPGRFWSSRSTMGKITGAIGLALGALGTGPDGINKSAQMIERAIDRDLDAQKSELAMRLKKGQSSVDAAQSAYAMEHQRFGNEAAAASAAKASLLALAENGLKKIAVGSAAPAAKAQALALAGQLQTKQGELENAAHNTYFDNITARITANAAAAPKAAPGAQDQKKQLLEIGEREMEIQQSGDRLKGLIGKYGTQEKWAPGVEAEMNQAINGMIIASAKMQDREGVVREPDEARERASLGFTPDFFQRGDAALKSIDSFMKNAKRRRDNALQVRGLQ